MTFKYVNYDYLVTCGETHPLLYLTMKNHLQRVPSVHWEIYYYLKSNKTMIPSLRMFYFDRVKYFTHWILLKLRSVCVNIFQGQNVLVRPFYISQHFLFIVLTYGIKKRA